MEMKAFSLNGKEDNEKLGVELQVSKGNGKDHYLSIYADKDLNLSFAMFKDGQMNNDEDLFLYADDKRTSNICEGILGDNVNAHYIFDNGSKYAIINRQKDLLRGGVAGYYVFIADKEEVEKLQLPEINVYTREQIATFISNFYANCDLRTEVTIDEFEKALLKRI
ncbi:MAG: hypothetical protein PHN54_00295 [Bacilli bacterium]|nr:hypothetical protein [Bacilli bacterium]